MWFFSVDVCSASFCTAYLFFWVRPICNVMEVMDVFVLFFVVKVLSVDEVVFVPKIELLSMKYSPLLVSKSKDPIIFPLGRYDNGG